MPFSLRGVIFDFDGPIFDGRAASQKALTATFDRYAQLVGRPGIPIATLPLYRSDAVLRRAAGLQAHPLTGECAIGLNPEDALALGLSDGAKAKVAGADGEVELPVIISRGVPRGGAWLEKTWPATRPLPPNGGMLTVTRA